MLDLLFDGWRADTRAGRRSLMLAADRQTVAHLNTLARAHRITAGQVRTDRETPLADGSKVAVGDVVVTRLNDRNLATGTGRGWVKNGDEWTVHAVGEDGSLTVRRGADGGVSVLPASYAAEHLELGYATTAHRAQGRTIDTAHAYVTATTLREPLYVMATRGRETNRLYVDTAYDPDHDTSHGRPDQAPVGDVLRAVIANTGADLSAHETRRDEEHSATSPTRLATEGAAITARRAAEREAAQTTSRWMPSDRSELGIEL